jgi:hypothetical protein
MTWDLICLPCWFDASLLPCSGTLAAGLCCSMLAYQKTNEAPLYYSGCMVDADSDFAFKDAQCMY